MTKERKKRQEKLKKKGIVWIKEEKTNADGCRGKEEEEEQRKKRKARKV